MQIGIFRFQTKIQWILLTSVGLAIFLLLGFWQLDRADKKARLSSQFEQQSRAKAIDLNSNEIEIDSMRYLPITVTGRYQSARQYLLDNQIHMGRAGYHVYTPLMLDDQERVVLINRGWIPLSGQRSNLPDLEVDEDNRFITGVVNRFPQPALKLGSPENQSNRWPKVLQYFELEMLKNQLKTPIHPFVVLLDPATADGYLREWRPPSSGEDRHKAYAIQWFSFALVLLIIFFALNTKKYNPGKSS